MKILLIRSPRYYWPFINEYDNFLLPQSLVCLAGSVRSIGWEVKIYDCMPLKMGWKTLTETIKQEKPEVVGVGDSESLYQDEVRKVINIAKEINPNIITVAGGAHFSNLIEESLNELPLDFIGRGEGEITLSCLLKEIEKTNPSFEKVKGIAFKKEGRIIITPPQPLIKNLDDLPLPAYDLLPLNLYGKGKYLFDPGGTTLHHSRGCTSNCDFCVWWVQMAEEEIQDGKIIKKPKWRTKSVEKMIEEIELLYYKYKRRGFVFVDDSWNIDPVWNEEFAERVIKRNLKFNWFAFMRADCLVRDEKNKILEKLVRAGLRHVSIGVERYGDEELKGLNKPFYSLDITKECFKILTDKYPQVFKQATFIVGTPEETREKMLSLVKYTKELNVDFPAFHPLTPVPGTKLWEEAKKKGWIEITDFNYYDWLTPVMSSKYLKREEIEELMYVLNRKFTNIKWLVKGLFSKHSYKRKMYIWWLMVFLRVTWRNLLQRIPPFSWKAYTFLVKPKWYNK